MRFLRVLPLLLIPILFYQCQKEISNVGNGSGPVVIGAEPVSAKLQGNIFDENDQPAQGVTIKVGTQTVVTDQRGYFSINNAALDKKSSVVTAEKAGYFKAYRTFAATSATNQVMIKLVQKTLAGTIDATTGGSVTLSGGAKIALPANGVVKASNNSAYTGTINVYAAYIDPSLPDIVQTVPGSFMANDKNGSRVSLASYGMMAVELESSSAEKLQIKSGSTASLTTPIPSSRLSSAPATIPLWYVNEQTGIWTEEGSATKQGDVYVGDVKHFTYWNCDMALPTVNVTLTVKTASGQPLSFVGINIKAANGTYYGSAHGYTDSLGVATGPVPANIGLILEIYSWCNNGQTIIYSQPVGPFSQNTNLGTITITNSTLQIVSITGQLNNCSGNPVSDGYAMIYYNNIMRVATANSSGVFNLTFPPCSISSTANMIGVDNTTQQQSSLTPITLTAPVTNVGVITACGTSTAQYFNYTMDGTPYNLSVNPADSMYHMNSSPVTGGYNTFFYFDVPPMGYVRLGFFHSTLSAGTYPVNRFEASPFISANNAVIAPFNAVVTNYPQSVGQYCEGTFGGQFKDSVNVTHTITNGSFRVRKSN